MMNNEFGSIVRSIAGHDYNKYYILIDSDEKFVFITDGKSRTVENPKKKNRRHIEFMSANMFSNLDKNHIKTQVTNEHIKRIIKEYRNQRNK